MSYYGPIRKNRAWKHAAFVCFGQEAEFHLHINSYWSQNLIYPTFVQSTLHTWRAFDVFRKDAKGAPVSRQGWYPRATDLTFYEISLRVWNYTCRKKNLHVSKPHQWFILEIKLVKLTQWQKLQMPLKKGENIRLINRPHTPYYAPIRKHITGKHALFLCSFKRAGCYLHMVHAGKVVPSTTTKRPKSMANLRIFARTENVANVPG